MMKSTDLYPRITQTNGNAANRIRGSRARVWAGDVLVGEVIVPHRDAMYYIGCHPGGKYGRAFDGLYKEAKAILASKKVSA